ncbi:MAG: hypothetical protein JXB44_16745 [Calditrichaceae bacterium]|nr:hypothetical protein [Calditrichaceae bacterium]
MKIKPILLIMFTIMSVNLCFTQTAEEAINLLEDEQGVGIKATSMGNAFTGLADDYTAIYWNPAGLAQLKKGEFNTAIFNQKHHTESLYGEQTTTEQQSYTKLHNIGFAYPFPVIQGSFVVAFGYQKTKDLDNIISFRGFNPYSNSKEFEIENDRGYYGFLPFDLGLQQGQTITNEGGISQWSAAAAVDLSPEFSAGLTLSFYGGTSIYNMAYSQDDIYENNSYNIYNEDEELIEYFYYNYYDLLQTINTEYSGFEIKAGGLYRFTDFFQAGATITFPMRLKVTEDWSANGELSYDIYSLQEDAIYEYLKKDNLGGGIFDYIIEVPYKFSIGAAYKTQLLTLSGSVDYRDWTQMKYAIPDDRYESDYTDLLSHNKLFRTDFRETLNMNTGAEIKLGNSSFRAGFRYVQSPYKKEIYGDLDKYYISAGAGFQVSENVVLEGSYSIGLWEKTNNYNYDWQSSDIMKVDEKHNSSRLLIGAKLLF